MNPAPLRIAWFSPLPPAQSGIADYSRELLPCLAEAARVDLYCDRPSEADPALRAAFPVLSLDGYPSRRWEYDAAIYQMGNSPYHEGIYRTFLRYPGIVDLHEYDVHDFMVYRTAGQGDWAALGRELAYGLGAPGARLAREIRLGLQPCVLESPLNDRLLDLALGLVVHSESARRRVEMRSPRLPVAVIPLVVQPPQQQRARRPAGWRRGALVFASAGHVTPLKGLNQALSAFARLYSAFPQARYLVIGEAHGADRELMERAHALGIVDAVRFTGFVDDLGEFAAWLAGADVVVNLRNPTLGEASSSALRALAAARPLIVSDHGWYADLPDDVCLKVPPGDESALLAAMLRLAGDSALRAALGRQGAAYVAAEHAPVVAARRYADFLAQRIRSFRPDRRSGRAMPPTVWGAEERQNGSCE